MHRFFCQYQILFYAVGIDLLNASTMLPVPGAPIAKGAEALIYRGYSCRAIGESMKVASVSKLAIIAALIGNSLISITRTARVNLRARWNFVC